MLIFLTTRFIKCNQDDIDDIDLQIRMNEGTYNYSPFFWWNINLFDFEDALNVEVRDHGLLLKNNGHITATITPYCYLLDENGHFKFNNSYSNISTGSVNSQEKNAVIETDNNILISIENQKIIYHIDKNSYDVYNDVVEKDDVNTATNSLMHLMPHLYLQNMLQILLILLNILE